MKIEESVYLNKLFESYGKLLSPKQQEVCELYFNDDLTLSEIGENLKISRQAVLDCISKVEKKLVDIENKLHLVSQIDQLKQENELLKNIKEE